MNDVAFFGVGAVLVIAFGGLAVVLNEFLRRRARIRRRIGAFGELLDSGEVSTAAPVLDTAAESKPMLASLERRFPLAGGKRALLASVIGAVVVACSLVPGLLFVGLPPMFAVAVGVLIAGAVGWNLGSTMEFRRRLEFIDRFLVGVEDFQRMVRFGMATGQAFKSVADAAQDPVRGVLRRVAVEADLGVPLGVALGREAHRIRISELAMLAAIMSTQSRTGGGLAESVGNLAEMLRERIDNRARMKASTSESKISLVVLCLVPGAAIGIQAVSQPQLFATLMSDARYLLGIGFGLILLGLTVAWFMVRNVER
ncbi:MAG: type II secretion system F family protein [Gammaproteobacteria bacterium]|nr:type II secretion system F family protein [Gammaproteobacteria bacterium]